MKKMFIAFVGVSMIFTLGYGESLYAGGPVIVKPPSGQHFTLNIIGVDKAKNPDMTGSNRHTIFVGLGSKTGGVITDIWLQNGYEFKVCDGNGLDAIAYDCSGNTIDQHSRSYGAASFQLPCNTNPDLVYTEGYGCPVEVEQRSYSVWARALGKPGFDATMMTCAYDVVGDLYCATENVLTLTRSKSRPTWMNATSQLTTLVANIDGLAGNETVALFAEGFEEFFWQYDNKGLRHAQIRFYPLTQ